MNQENAFTCAICSTEYDVPDLPIHNCPCGSEWCTSCLQQAFVASLTGPLPLCGCGDPINYHDYINGLDPEFLSEHDEKLTLRTAIAPLHCANDECGKFLLDRARSNLELEWAVCETCQSETCLKCHNLWPAHEDVDSCPENATDAAANNILASALEMGLDLSRCRCGHVIERVGGCGHMSCVRCGYQYCAICLQPLPCECGLDAGDNNDYNELDNRHDYIELDDEAYNNEYGNPRPHYGWNPNPVWTAEELDQAELGVMEARLERRRQLYDISQELLNPESDILETDGWGFLNDLPHIRPNPALPDREPLWCGMQNIDLTRRRPGFAPAEGGDDEDFQSYMEVLDEHGRRTGVIACPHDEYFARSPVGGRCEGHCDEYLQHWLNTCLLCGTKFCSPCLHGRKFSTTRPVHREPSPGWAIAGRNVIFTVVLWTLGCAIVDKVSSHFV